MTRADARLDLVRELAVLARALEARGAYNGGKLLRAAMDAHLTRLAVEDAPADSAALAERIDSLAARLRSDDLADDVADRLPAVVRALRDDGIVSLEIAPPAHVCRACGELFLGEVPASCPTCEAPPSAFREHLPIWFLEPITRAAVLRELGDGTARVLASVHGRDDEMLARSPRAGEWSARDTLDHLVSTEELLADRIARLLAEEAPDFAAVSVGAASPRSDEATGVTAEPASRLVDRFRAAREANLGRLAGLPVADWERSGRHPEWGTVTVLSQAAYFARHQASHGAQLSAAADGRVPGERLPR
jgi:hypothetical protein